MQRFLADGVLPLIPKEIVFTCFSSPSPAVSQWSPNSSSPPMQSRWALGLFWMEPLAPHLHPYTALCEILLYLGSNCQIGSIPSDKSELGGLCVGSCCFLDLQNWCLPGGALFIFNKFPRVRMGRGNWAQRGKTTSWRSHSWWPAKPEVDVRSSNVSANS